MTQTNERLCPTCRVGMEHMEQFHWLFSHCSQCGILWLEGDNLAQTIQHLHLTHLDSERAFSELGSILRRGLTGNALAAKKLAYGGTHK